MVQEQLGQVVNRGAQEDFEECPVILIHFILWILFDIPCGTDKLVRLVRREIVRVAKRDAGQCPVPIVKVSFHRDDGRIGQVAAVLQKTHVDTAYDHRNTDEVQQETGIADIRRGVAWYSVPKEGVI